MRQLLEHLGIGQAYIAGLSMGAATALSFAIAHPDMCRGVIVAATGTGSTDREMHLEAWRNNVERLKAEGIAGYADEYANGPTRVQFKRKDPVGWEKFYAGLAGHSALGSALITQGIQLKRPTVFQMEEKMRRLEVPTLLLAGDEDDPCIEPMLFIKRCVASSGLVFFPQSGHTINLEEPAPVQPYGAGFPDSRGSGRMGDSPSIVATTVGSLRQSSLVAATSGGRR